MPDPAERIRMAPEEYLAFERASEVKHEYADGEVFAMAGGSLQQHLTRAIVAVAPRFEQHPVIRGLEIHPCVVAHHWALVAHATCRRRIPITGRIDGTTPEPRTRARAKSLSGGPGRPEKHSSLTRPSAGILRHPMISE